MRVRDWDDIVSEVVESKADPEGWRAVAGDRANGLGEDFYVGHPNSGVYQLKTYAKNPFEVRGVGTQIARKLDDEIGSFFPEQQESSRFAVQAPPEDEDDAEDRAKKLQAVLQAHADAPTTPGDLFDDMMDALESPAFGPMEYDQYDRPEKLDDLATTFEDAEKVLDAELDDLIDEDEVGRGFM
ncbi:hypothetical protein [Haloarchaeobius sp. DT45]|uniref:hypothetical protein n=1 Tax=Haloarchaeobius sp. DT45 TaxID=3446116 RepID=UPI003F6B2CEE